MKENIVTHLAKTEGAPQQRGNEAAEFVERFRDFFEHYARGKVRFEPAPESDPTFSFNLETNTIRIHPMFYAELGLSEQKTAFATCHEIEHFLEKLAMLAEDGGTEAFARYIERIKKSRAFSLVDNCVADIRENGAVVKKTNSAWREIEQLCYRENLFPETDFTREPRHVQFAYALLRESRVPDETCSVAPEVRAELDSLRSIVDEDGTPLLDVMTDPDVPMSERLFLQDAFVWPSVEKLLQQDIADEVKRQKTGGEEQQGESGDEQGGEGGQEGDDGEEGKRSDEDGDPGGPGRSGGDPGGPSKPGGGSGSSPNRPKEGKGTKKRGNTTPEKNPVTDPNELFKDSYDRARRKMPEAMSEEKMDDLLKQWKEQVESEKNSSEKSDEAYAKKIGVEKHALQQYRSIVASLESIKNPETDESVVDELRALIERVIAKRLKPRFAPKYPTEEGEEIVDPAELIAQVRAGNLEPKVWETFDIQEQRGERFGEVEITLVCDRSGSMGDGSKWKEQQRSAVLLMEALKEFAERCEEERTRVEKPLEVRSEIYTFQSAREDARPVKQMSSELTEKERIDTMSLLENIGGSTTDFVPLESIAGTLSEDTERKIKDGEIKKIVIVFTDGESDDDERVHRVLEVLSAKGVVVVGVGITESGRAALDTYAPNARLAPRAEHLPAVLADILKEHLKSV